MSPDLKPGLRHVQTLRVTPAATVPGLAGTFPSFAGMPPVFATAMLVGFAEWACIEALAPYLGAGERTVGTRVDLSHTAATPIGMEVTAEVTLVAVEGRILRFKVACRDEAGPIGEGTHERAVIDEARFLAKVAAKAEEAGRVRGV